MQFDPQKAQFTDQELENAARVGRLVRTAVNIKGDDGKLDAGDFLAVTGAVPDVVGLIEYLTEGVEGPEDDHQVAARVIALGAAFGRGAGLFEGIGAPKEE